MKYILSKNKWVNDEGLGIDDFLLASDSYEPSEFMFPQEPTGQILAYVNDSFDVANYVDFDACELSQEDALIFAKQLSENSFIAENGKIEMPYRGA